MSKIDWLPIDDMGKLESIKALSHTSPCLIFKHSTRCSISSLAKNRLDKSWDYSRGKVVPFFLDVIAHREISNAIAEEYGVRHQSPQMLVIKDGRCVYDASHLDIGTNELDKQLM